MFDVIMPIYQVNLDYLKEAIDSVLNQSFSHWELWICDGTPETWPDYELHCEYMEWLVTQDVRIHWVIQEGLGVSAARNQVAALGSEPLLAFLDGDDYWETNHLLEHYAGSIGTHPSGIRFSKMEAEGTLPTDSGNFVTHMTHTLHEYKSYIDCPEDKHYWYFCNTPIWTPAVSCGRYDFERVGGFDETIPVNEDLELWLRIMGIPEGPDYETPQIWRSAHLIDTVTVYHREHSEATTEGGTQTSASPQIIAAIRESDKDWLDMYEHLPNPTSILRPKWADFEFWYEVLTWWRHGKNKGVRHSNFKYDIAPHVNSALDEEAEEDEELERLWRDK